MFMPKLIAATSALAVAATGLGTPVTPISGSPQRGASAGMSLVSSRVVNDDRCAERVAAQQQSGEDSGLRTDCSVNIVVYASAPRIATPEDLKVRVSDGSSGAARQLLHEAENGNVQSRDSSQQMNNITDAETQRGTFYFDGSHVWVTTATDGVSGTHICQVDWAVGYAVNNVWCGEEGSDSQRDLYAQWSFSLVASGSPVRWDETYTLHVGADGSIWQ